MLKALIISSLGLPIKCLWSGSSRALWTQSLVGVRLVVVPLGVIEVVNILVWRGIVWAWCGFGGLDVGRGREVGGM